MVNASIEILVILRHYFKLGLKDEPACRIKEEKNPKKKN